MDQAKCSGEKQEHKEENLSTDLANERSLTLAGEVQGRVADRSQIPALCSSLVGDGHSRKDDAMEGSISSDSCSLVPPAKTISPPCLQEDG